MRGQQGRARMLIRTWNILVLLRDKPQTIDLLASACEVHPRTIRRDVEALRAAQFPISFKHGWCVLAPMEAWPTHEPTPTGKLSDSTAT